LGVGRYGESVPLLLIPAIATWNLFGGPTADAERLSHHNPSPAYLMGTCLRPSRVAPARPYLVTSRLHAVVPA